MNQLIKEANITLELGKEIQFANELKKVYQEQYQIIKGLKDITGKEVCQRITESADAIIYTLYQQVAKTYNLSPDLTIIALGGYGRCELNPFSDIDLLFLHVKENDKITEEFITKMLYVLWDIKLILGHSSRTLKNVISMANQDLIFKTSIIDHRFLCGDSKLYNQFQSTVEKIFKKNRYRYYQELLTKMKYHMQNLGESVLLKEPNLKESLGALRGIHLVRWLSYNFFQTNTLSSLYENNMLEREDWHKLENHLSFLLAVRNELHFFKDRKDDILSLENQEFIAQNVVLTETIDRSSKVSVERLRIEHYMRDFYHRAKDVFQFVMSLIDQFDLEANKYLQFARFTNRRKMINEDFMIISNKLFLRKKQNDIQFSPSFLMEIFLKISRYGCSLSGEIEQYIKSNLNQIDDSFRLNTHVFSLFKELLSTERNLYKTLSTMRHVGFLTHYIPFFNELECTVQHDYYHAYTIDEHTLQGIKKIEELYHKENRNYFFLKNVLQNLDKNKRFLLILSIFFHDIGKGRPGSHVKNGEQMIDFIVNAFPFEDEEKETLTFLVNNHLSMVHISQRRDIHDLKVIYHFAHQVKEIEKLDLLLLLSYADMDSVAPKVYTLWKGELLKELYKTTSTLLSETPDGKLPILKPNDFEKIKTKIMENIPLENKDFANSFFNEIDSRYFIDNDISEIITAISILKEINEKHAVRYEKALDSYIFKFYGKDKPGLFSRIALILSINGITIHSANLYSKTGGYAIDHFIVGSIYSSDEISDSRWDAIVSDMNQYLDADINDAVKQLIEKKKSPIGKTQAIIPKTKVLIDNNLSDQFTVIEVQSLDRLGLLYFIARILSAYQINIISAFVTTRGNQAIDTFYVESDSGKQITQDDLMNKLKQMLIVGTMNYHHDIIFDTSNPFFYDPA